MRAASFFLLLGLAAGSALAQTPAPTTADAAPQEPLDGRLNQRVERILIEDEGSRVSELRVGGQTQSITVQPKTGSLPAYEVQPTDGVHARPGSRNGAETITGPRLWNLRKF